MILAEGLPYPHAHLCFDDHSVSSWHSVKGILSDHGARAVFYVDSFHELTDAEVEMLSDLRDDGHVVGCHGKRHIDALSYSKRFDVDRYIDDEVLPAMEDMAGMGFEPTHFAFPHSHFDEVLYSAVSPLFCYVRPGHESHYYSGDRMFISPTRFTKTEVPREKRIREGDLSGVLEGLRATAEAQRGISIVFHDIRPVGARAHTGTHARGHITQEELVAVLKTLNYCGYSYETFQERCREAEKPNSLP
jgi:hypothetical protein